MKLIITGATGVAGLNIYRAALADPEVTSITLIQRRQMPSWAALPPNAADKTTSIIHTDFETYSTEIASKPVHHDACIWALGKTVRGMSEAEYTQLTHDYPMAFVKALRDAGVEKDRKDDEPFRFVYVSGEMADPAEKSLLMWANIKGRTEKDLTKFCEETTGLKVHNFRPAYFASNERYPNDATNQRPALENVVHRIIGPFFKYVVPSNFTPIEDLASVAVGLAKGRWPDIQVLGNAKIKELAKELH